MKIAYLYDRNIQDAADWGCEKVFADTPETRRMERNDLIEHALAPGDTLCIAARSDIGRGREVPILLERIAAMGVYVDVRGEPAKPKGKPGRKAKLDPTPDQEAQICRLWGSALDQSHVLERAAEIAGVEGVTRNQINRLCGPRHKKQKEQSE